MFVDVIIGGKTVATMPAGKLLGGMGLFFGGTRTVDCGGGSEGGVIAAIRFDALEEMVTTTPEVAVRVYGAIAMHLHIYVPPRRVRVWSHAIVLPGICMGE